METDASIVGLLLTALLGQLPMLLVDFGFAVALLAILLSRQDSLGRARVPAIAGAGMLAGLALLTRLVFAGLQVCALAGSLPSQSVGTAYAVAGGVLQGLHGVAIILLGVAIVRK